MDRGKPRACLRLGIRRLSWNHSRFLEYPAVNYHDVLHVCDPWIRQDEIETAMMDTGVNASYADFSNGCDLGSHSGYSRAREMLFQWVVMHVPRGPAELFPEEVVDDPRRASRAKRYLKLVRHLLLLG